MDPNATFDALVDAIKAADYDAARELLDALVEWELKGGFKPTA